MAQKTYDDLTVILPTYNEGGNIQSMLETLVSLYPGVSIVVADDNSKDETSDLVRSFSLKHPKARLLSRDPNDRGLTASIMEGISETRTKWFVVMDADFQHPPESVGGMYGLLTEGADMAVGKREDKTSLSFSRMLASWGANALAKSYLAVMRRPTTEDTMSGFFGGRTDLCQEVVTKHGRKFERAGFKVLFDILKFLPRDTVVKELEFQFSSRRAGKSKLSSRVILSILRQCGPAGKAAALGVNFLFINMLGRYISALALGLAFTFAMMETLSVTYDDRLINSTILAFVLALAYLVVANKYLFSHGKRDRLIIGAKMVFTGFSGFMISVFFFYMLLSSDQAVHTWPMFLGFGIAYLWNTLSSVIPEK
ncbi:MAG TPA: glycosyltransferase [Methanomassiliicoccales archaeon]|nr:glycosyltransferase [Methanomassiliicoccales archaeon]